MSSAWGSALENAKQAARHAGEIDDSNNRGYQDLIVVAQLNANIAQAEALTRIADRLDQAFDDGVIRTVIDLLDAIAKRR